MSVEPAAEQIEMQQSSVDRLPLPSAKWVRVLYGVFILVMPFIAFWATELFKPEWQDGKLSSYMILLLSPAASWIFFPLLAFSIVCYLLLLIDYTRYASKFVIRLGIYVGTLLALQFSLLSGLFLIKDNSFSPFLIITWLFPLIILTINQRTRWDSRKVLLASVALVILVALFLSVAVVKSSLIYAPLIVLLVGLTVAAPFWSFLLYLRAAIWLFKNVEMKLTLSPGLGLTAWLGAYLLAWRYSILKMYELYAALPPTPPPDCYIATAAAHGHPRFVGSRIVVRADGTSMAVNKQLQILKCGEFALMVICPRLHKMLRRIYDVIGRTLARKIQNPFMADLAYLFLKPWEWLARSTVKMLIPEFDSISNEIYGR